MSERELRDGSWYDYPQYYDVALQEDTEVEADFVQAIWKRLRKTKLKTVLEPGCGSGRLVVELAKRGVKVVGFDDNRKMLDYAEGRLRDLELSANLFSADLADFQIAKAVDLAYSFCNTFRHLLDEDSARRHLQSIAEALRPGGLYILGLHLMPIDADPEDSEQWTEKAGDVEVTVTLTVHKTLPELRREILRVTTDVASPAESFRLRGWMPLRLYDVDEFRSLLASVPEFKLLETYDFLYDEDDPIELDEYTSDLVVVLQKTTG